MIPLEPLLRNRICRNCLRAEEEHCFFQPIEIPNGCVCDPRTWLPNDIGPICRKYKGNGTESCSDCEHDKECHSTGPADENRDQGLHGEMEAGGTP